MNNITRAAVFAATAHTGQFRKYGHEHHPYIFHPGRVAARAMMLGFGDIMVQAAWLHDVVEDTPVTHEELIREFGHDVALLVDELTNKSKVTPGHPRAERKAMDRAHIATISKPAKILKLLDRIDNVRECLDDSEAPSTWVALYLQESRLLLNEALRGAYPELEQELDDWVELGQALA